ncbi:unnamed protein product [Clonostachys rosea]|uniref:hydroxymethylglutaryl-CoA reductase (NADPH) n=1 Tax=Bionectria ochroleuca TaxID=29856 RepID=A0ABY6UVP0_BIOOC|nr:unnamed protein product [Clonostachys rosea]
MTSPGRQTRLDDLIRDLNLKHIPTKDVDHIRVENCIGFSKVPVGIAGPLRVSGAGLDGDIFAPLATYEPTLVASCSRGCKAFGDRGVQFEVLSEGMSRGPVFIFDDPGSAVKFAREFPALQDQFAQWASSTSRYVRLQQTKVHVIGSQTHVYCTFYCGGAAGQNMVTKATQFACDMLRKTYAVEFSIRDFFLEGQMASDKKPSWGNVKAARGIEVVCWGTIENDRCQEILGCTTQRLHHLLSTGKEGGIRNGQFGCNINTANIIAAMFISTGQDAGSTAEASWSHLTSEYSTETRELVMSLYIPSLPVGTVGGGTSYPTQKEALRIVQCDGLTMKGRLAGVIACFALALDVSTSAAVATDTFTESHMKLARGPRTAKL